MTIDRILNQNQKRLSHIEKILYELDEKQGNFELEKTRAYDHNQKFAIDRDIEKIKKEILRYEAEYLQKYLKIYPTEAIDISEEEAQSELAEIEQVAKSIENTESIVYLSEKSITLLRNITTILEDRHKTAATKLKLVLPFIPGIASIELDINSNGLMPKILKRIREIILRDTIKK